MIVQRGRTRSCRRNRRPRARSAVMGGEIREIALAREFVNESDAADNRSRLCETGLVNEAVPRLTSIYHNFAASVFARRDISSVPGRSISIGRDNYRRPSVARRSGYFTAGMHLPAQL